MLTPPDRTELLLQAATTVRTSASERLKQLGYDLPPAFPASGLYVPAVVDGNRLLIAGHGPWPKGPPPAEPIKGMLGRGMLKDHGKKAAFQVALGVLRIIQDTVGIDAVVRLIETVGYIAAEDNFQDHLYVLDGFSEVMRDVFGSVFGVGARTAIGVSSLPFRIPVEVKATFEIRPASAPVRPLTSSTDAQPDAAATAPEPPRH